MSCDTVFLECLPRLLLLCRAKWQSTSLKLRLESLHQENESREENDDDDIVTLSTTVDGKRWAAKTRSISNTFTEPYVNIRSLYEGFSKVPECAILQNDSTTVHSIWMNEDSTSIVVEFRQSEEKLLNDGQMMSLIGYALNQAIRTNEYTVADIELISLRFAYFGNLIVKVSLILALNVWNMDLYSNEGAKLGEIYGIKLMKYYDDFPFRKEVVANNLKKLEDQSTMSDLGENEYKPDAGRRSENSGAKSNMRNHNDHKSTTAIIKSLLSEWLDREVFNDFNEDDSFFTLGLDSISLVDFEARLQDLFPESRLPSAIALRNPTVSKLASCLERIAKDENENYENIGEIEICDKISKIPLSSMQTQLVFLSQMNPDDCAQFNEPMIAKIANLNIKALQDAVNIVIANETILRTIYKNDEQIAFSSTESFICLYESSENDFQTFLDAKISIFNSIPVKCFLTKSENQGHIFALVFHHIAIDGKSMRILQQNIMHFYDCVIKKKQFAMKRCQLQYADWASYQQTLIQGSSLIDQEIYWRHCLDGYVPTERSYDRSRPAMQLHCGATVLVPLPRATSQKMRHIQTIFQCSQFALFASLYFVLQFRLYEFDDQCVGFPITLREIRWKNIDKIIGNFLNTIILRAKITSNDEKFADFTARVSDEIANGIANKWVPFDRIVQSRQSSGANSIVTETSPVFQTMLVMDEIEELDSQTNFEPIFSPTNYTKYEQIWYFMETKKRGTNSDLAIRIEYNKDLFYSETISETIQRYFFLIDQIASRPSSITLADVESATVAEKMAQYEFRQRNRVDFPHRPVPEILSLNIIKSPLQITFENRSIDTAELDRQSNRFGHFLLQRFLTVTGELPCGDSPVALFLNRSIEQLVVIVAMCKCGLPFVPLSIDWPTERRRTILEELNWPLIIRDADLDQTYENIDDTREIILSQCGWTRFPIECSLNCSTSLFSLAYITYTSGSTGVPKGVCTNWSGLSNLLAAYTQDMAINNTSVIYQVVNYSFDICYADIFKALINGASLLLAKSQIPTIDELETITHAYIMPAYLASGERILDPISKLRCLQIGGESPRSTFVDRLIDKGVKIVQEFGFTEQTVFSTRKRMRRLTSLTTVGLPYPNIHVSLTTEDLRQAPCSGKWRSQLCAGGISLARGYFGSDKLTHEKFVADPWLTIEERIRGEGKRLFLTGDRAKIGMDLDVQVCERMDFQVKLRGHRIELGEIEQAIIATGLVNACVVLLRVGEFCAYLMLRDWNESNNVTERLREQIARYLPEFMVPQRFVLLKQFPLTSNGKLDRTRLAKYDCEVVVSKEKIEPESQNESRVREICCRVLNVENLGVSDSLFELGGANSLKIMILAQNLGAEFGVDVPIRQLFVNKTIREISKLIHASSRVEATVSKKSSRDVDTVDKNALFDAAIKNSSRDVERATGSIPLSFAQERLWFLRNFDDGDKANSTSYWMHFKITMPQLSLKIMRIAVNSIVQKQTILRSAIIEPNPGLPMQKVYSATEMHFALNQGSFNTVATLQHKNATLLICLEECESGDACLCFAINHLIIDGWSLRIMGEQLSQYCNSLIQGSHAMDRLAIQYADYCIEQRSRPAHQDIDFWLNKLKNNEPIDLPTDFKRPKVFDKSGKTMNFLLCSKHEMKKLEELTLNQDCTLFMVLLAAYGLLLQYISGQDTVFVGVPVANRDYNMQDVVGCFVNSVVMRIESGNGLTVTEFFASVKNTVIEALANQAIPFETVVEKLTPDRRDLSRTPLFQVMFVLQNASVEKLDAIHGRAISVQEIKLPYSKFEQTWSLSENENGLQLEVEYCTALFRDETIRETVRLYRYLLHSSAHSTKSTRIDELRYFDESRNLKSCSLICDTPKNYTLTDIFQVQCHLSRDATFLQLPQRVWSYAESLNIVYKLGDMISELIFQETGASPCPDDPIAIYCPEGIEIHLLIAAILSIGSPYVPIDPRTPIERVRAIVVKSQSRLLISNVDFHIDDVEVIGVRSLFSDCDKVKERSREMPRGKIGSSRDLAYILYTSGTTGTPKGVCIEHQAVINVVEFNTRFYPFKNNNAGVYQFTRQAFDASAANTFGAMINGCKLCLSSEKLEIIDDLEQYFPINLIHMTPAVLATFSNSEIEKLRRNIGRISVGGETMSKRAMNCFLDKGIPLIQLYGPTEATITQIATKMKRHSHFTRKIGHVIDNMIAVLLARGGHHRHVLAINGFPGELLLVGENLARGYVDQVELTATKFVKNPQQTIEEQVKGINKRGFKTGDLLKILPSDEAIFLGRLDEQAKVRGYRVEIGDIESAINIYDEIRSSAVRIVKNEISAYFVAEKSIEIDKLSQFLSSRLPFYMLPSQYLQIEKMPLNSNLKIDKRALPDIATLNQGSGDYVEPESEIESTILEIWKLALRSDQLTVSCNFFEAGGHSLIAARVIAMINEKLGMSVKVRDIFEHQTVRKLAHYITSTCEESEQSTQSDSNVDEFVGVDLSTRNNIENRTLPISKDNRTISDVQKLTGQIVPKVPVCRLQIPILEIFRGMDNMAKMAYICKLNLKLPKNVIIATKLEHSINALIMANYALRTVFVTDEENFFQLPVSGTECFIRLTATISSIRDEGMKPPVLIPPIMIEMDIFDNLTIYTSHLLVDGRSMEIFASELQHLYDGQTNKLPTSSTKMSYYEFSIEYNQIANDKNQANLAFWEEKFERIQRSTLLTDFTKTNEMHQSFAGASKIYEFRSLNLMIKETAQRYRCSPFAVIVSAFHLLLRLYSHDHKNTIVIGSPSTTRTDRFETTIGYFVNTIILVFDKFLNSVQDLLSTAQTTIDSALEHREIDYEQLLQISGKGKLFDAMLVLDNYSDFHNDQGLFEVIPESVTATKFPLTLFVRQKNNNIVAEMEYMTDLFRPETIKMIMRRWANLIQALNTCSVLPSEFYLSSTEVLEFKRQTVCDFPRQQSISTIFKGQYLSTPNYSCIKFNESQVSYHELWQKISRISSNLEQRFVQATGELITSDDVVALVQEKSIEAIACILAVLNLGVGYLPVDSTFPDERIRVILSDCSTRIYLCERNFRLDSRLQIDPASLFHHSDSGTIPVPYRSQASDLGYIIYSSGTTGTPKGIAIAQLGLLNMMRESTVNFRMRPYDDTVYHFTAHCYDNSVLEMLTALCNGAKLFVPSSSTSSNIADHFETHPVSHILLFPGLVDSFNEEEVISLRQLRYWIVGAEKANQRTIDRCLSMGVKIVQNYGPTETTAYAMTKHLRIGDHANNIGQSIGNSYSFLVDDFGTLIPDGIPGELSIASLCLLRGYVNLNQKFTANPLSDLESRAKNVAQKTYPTGDFVVNTPNGTIFLSRRDTQVKIRGRRVELGEIETVIRERVADVKQCVVVFLNESQIFVAYFTTDSCSSISKQTFKDAISVVLPRHMIPAHFVHLKSMPLTRNAKIDRLRLPHPQTIPLDADRIAPRSHVEKVLLKLWQEVIYAGDFGINCDFFAIGGNSLNAGRLCIKIERHFNVDFEPATIFKYSTIEEQAVFIEMKSKNPESRRDKMESSDDSQDQIPLSANQEQMWFLHQSSDPVHRHCYNLSLIQDFGLNLDIKILHCAFMLCVAEQTSLRTCFREAENGIPFQIVLSLTEIFFSASCHDCDDENRLWTSLEQFQRLPFHLIDGPPIRCQLFFLVDSQKFVLQIVMHHIISDAWSTNLLENTVASNYLSLKANTLKIKKLDYHYADYSRCQKTFEYEQKIETGLLYWQKALQNLNTSFDLQTVFRLRTNADPFSICTKRPFAINFSQEIRNFCKTNKVTPFVVFLVTLYLLVEKLSGLKTIVIGSPIANRCSQTANLIGYFLNNIVLRCDFRNEMTVADLIDQAKTIVTEAVSHGFVPFNRIVSRCCTTRRTSATEPLYQIYFNCRYDLEAEQTLGIADIQQSRYVEDVINHSAHCIELSVDQEIAGGDFRGCFRLQPHVGSQGDIDSLAGNYTRILEQILYSDTKITTLRKIRATFLNRSSECIANILTQIWHKCLNHSNFSPQSNFLHVGGNSLMTLKLRKLIEDDLNVREISIDDIFRNLTFQSMAGLIEKNLSSHKPKRFSENVIIHINSPKATTQPVTLVFFHPLVGGAFFPYSNLFKLLALPEAKILGVQHPNTFRSRTNDKVNQFDQSIENLVAQYVDALSEDLHGRIVLVGASLGGLLAFECGLQLQLRGILPAAIVCIDSRPEPWKTAPTTYETHFRQMSDTLSLFQSSNRDYEIERNRENTLNQDDDGDRLLDRQTKINMINNAWHLLTLSRNYSPNGILNCPIWIYKVTDEYADTDDDYGWRKFCGCNLTVENIAGRHETMLDAENCAELARKIQTIVAEISDEPI